MTCHFYRPQYRAQEGAVVHLIYGVFSGYFYSHNTDDLKKKVISV